ncbi:MAG TPA: sensor domain-containing diguanylate cyclase [Dissulfurispiraceae bacterium]|nr:sensor domain-containing diguanylate cyclase [Dissulfurispiraceae bacterium]
MASPGFPVSLLLERLYRSCLSGTSTPILLEGLNERELLVAQKLNEQCAEGERNKLVSKALHRALNEVDRFYEFSIRALSALIKVGRIDGNLVETDHFCRNVLDIFAEELDFENCSIMLKEQDGTSLRLMAGKGKGDRYASASFSNKIGSVFPIGEGIAGMVAQTGTYVFIPDISKDARFKRFDMKVEVTSLLSVPIQAEDEIIGVINFSHPQADIFDENMVNVVMILSSFVGQMILLKQLYAKIANWNEELKKEVERKTEDLKKKNAQLRRTTLIDPLTGIFNRRFFFKKLDEEFLRHQRYNEPFSLLALDIDNLKPVNDTYGHLAGDTVIKGIVHVMKLVGRRGDALCRVGGDEFAYILLNSDMEGARKFSQRVQDRFRKLEFKGISVRPTVSIGIANTGVAKFLDSLDMYRGADEALYRAKQQRDAICAFGEPIG